MCRIWMNVVAGKEMKEGICLLSVIGTVIVLIRIVLMIIVAVSYHSAYAGFALIDIFALLAFFLIYKNIECERDFWILLGVTIHIVVIIYLIVFCLVAVVWMLLYKTEFHNFLITLLLTSVSMIFLVFGIYYVMAVLSEYNQRMLVKYCRSRESQHESVECCSE
ncbi:unnamed protein product [Bemisia tabaci]|uniref:Uncharacterized protein n=1 Tax=Bemisia tabaci TaxID=7038 RepID=A0A9P0F8A0_BEMTA|nr:PREDICTED: uncharacterized protein LOC109030034 [Bemisia tabaci]CAH0393899.1 unnamed protein product [Bemisia tabaci]